MVRYRTGAVLATVAVVTALVLPPAVALAGGTTIQENKGVAGATLGMKDSAAEKKIGKAAVSKRDDSYEGQVVYVKCFGKRSGGKYALEMYSNRKHLVFTFVVNSSGYATTKGIRIGSRESVLKKAYGKALRRYGGSVYVRYTLSSSRAATDFQVRSGKVQSITVRSK